MSEKSSRKLSSELLALTIGVRLWYKKINPTVTVRHPPHKENVTSTLPITYLNVRNSVFLSSHRVLFPFDLYSSGHGTHVTASESTDNLTRGNNIILRQCHTVNHTDFGLTRQKHDECHC